MSEAVDRGDVTIRTREKLPYGLAIFDDRVGLDGYDDDTGLMQVFVDTNSPMAREWAERVYASIKADSTPLEPTWSRDISASPSSSGHWGLDEYTLGTCSRRAGYKPSIPSLVATRRFHRW